MTLGHGNMVEPPARATMHDYGFPDNPRDSNWMEGFCGGKAHQWSEKIGGKCGICGDPWDAAVREHEAPDGKYANGEIVRFYKPGDIITITSHITANHVGFVEVRLCINDNVEQDPEQECFDQNDALKWVATGDNIFNVTEAMGPGKFSAQVKLPEVECEQCILQWTYRNGRDWGTCDGACGEVETFRGCSDISIKSTNTNPTMPTEVPATTENENNEQTTDGNNQETTWANNEETTEANNEETTSEEASTVAVGDTCQATGAWTGDASMDDWCQENCHYDPPHCPKEMCSCQDSPQGVAIHQVQVEVQCFATGPWVGNEAVSKWCDTNCKATPSFCPDHICTCS